MSENRSRRTFIGASEVAAILGLSPWKTAYDVWAEKTGRIEPPAETPAMWVGKKLESAILDYAETQLGPLVRNAEFAIQGAPIVAHPDAIIAKNGEPVEAKTTGLLRFDELKDWGPEGSDQIPDYYVVQCLIQLEATGAPVCHVPAFVGGRGLLMYRVEANKDVQLYLVEQCIAFWERYVLKDVPPPDSLPSLDVAAKIRRQPKSTTTISDPSLVDKWLEIKDAIRQLEEKEQELRQAILGQLGDCEVGILPDGREVTYFEQHRREYVVPATTFRVLRIRTPKPQKSRREVAP